MLIGLEEKFREVTSQWTVKSHASFFLKVQPETQHAVELSVKMSKIKDKKKSLSQYLAFIL